MKTKVLTYIAGDPRMVKCYSMDSSENEIICYGTSSTTELLPIVQNIRLNGVYHSQNYIPTIIAI